jgi:hypothetical protein
MRKRRKHHAALWLCVDNSSSGESAIFRSEQIANSRKCQEPGMARRVRHLRTCQSDAPADLAAEAIAGQRCVEKMSMRLSKDRSSSLSRSSLPLIGKIRLPSLGMTVPVSEKMYRAKLRERMIAARDQWQFSQQDMADKLHIPLWRYQKMEQRGGLPPYLFELFAALTREDILYLLTGSRAHITSQVAEPVRKTNGRKPRSARLG